MNFGAVLEVVAGFLEEKGVPYAVIGGVALYVYGNLRTTRDLDFVVDASVQDELIQHLESRGYRTVHRSSGYSNHAHPDPDWGEVDFVYIRGETSAKLFESCRLQPGPSETQVPVPKPEHLIAMKVQALKNDPARRFQDSADIRFLMSLPGVDRQEVRRYFERHDMRDQFDEIEGTLGPP